MELDHEHNMEVSWSEPATCGSYGEVRYSCECYSAYTEWLEPNGIHSYNEKIAAHPSCTDAGVKVKTCTECGHIENETLPMTDHTYGKGVAQISNCTMPGTRTYTCTGCGYEKTETIPAIGQHTYTEKITQKATCTAAGTKEYTCEKCNYKETETIPMVGHSYEVTETAATVLSPAIKTSICSVCQNKVTEITGEKLPAILELPGELTSLQIKKGRTVKARLVMAEGDSVVSCVSQNKKCVRASVDKETGTVTLTGRKSGSSKITIELASGKTRTYTVKVTKAGKVTAVSAGTAKITVKSGS